MRVRLCDLLGHLQRSGERDCQEFYRALYIHAQPLHGLLPSRLAPRTCTTALMPVSPWVPPPLRTLRRRTQGLRLVLAWRDGPRPSAQVAA